MMIKKVFALGGAIVLLAAAMSVSAQNTISGIVLDNDRRPVAKIEVELLDEFERFVKSEKTNSSGLYIFAGLRASTYYVQIRTDGTNFKSVKERVQIGQTNRTNRTTGAISGSETLQVNFILEVERRDKAPTNNEVVFAQNVPPEAAEHFENALKYLKDEKTDEALGELESALNIFPDYFLALEKLGYASLGKGDFVGAEKVFTRATAVNPRSFSAKSGLGIARFKLGRFAEAAKAIEEAIVLNPSSANSFLFLGRIYRETKNFESAETALKKAAELSGNKLADVHWELALLYYYDLDRPAAAADRLELYLKANPNAGNRSQIEKLIKTMREKAAKKND